MKKRIESLDELRDSRFMMEKEMAPYGFFLILVVALAMIGTLIWAIYTPKVYVIRSSGNVTDEDAHFVMSPYTGEIVSCDVKEGQLVDKGDVLFTIKTTELDLKKQQLEASLSIYKESVDNYKLLVKSIEEEKNYFKKDDANTNLYYSTYEIYKAQLAENAFNPETYKQYGYDDEMIKAQKKINEKKLQEIHYTAIQSAEKSIQDFNRQVMDVQAQIKALQDGKGDYQIKASNAGIIHFFNDCKEGMMVQATAAVAGIAKENAETVIENYLTASDRVRMQEGDSVQLEVQGLSQAIYGFLDGVVERVDSNSTTLDNGDGSKVSVFKVLIKPNRDYLVSKTGEKAELYNGMSVEVRIQYDKISYWNYLLEKIGLYTR